MGKRQENPAITGIDHVVVGVGDLEGARRTWETLGFTLTPRGRHKGWGTANYCVMFADDYIEPCLSGLHPHPTRARMGANRI